MASRGGKPDRRDRFCLRAGWCSLGTGAQRRLAPGKIVEAKGLKQESDVDAIKLLCQQVIESNPKSVEDYRAGKGAAINLLKGQVMKASKGKANPNLVGELLEKLLGGE